MAPTLVGKGRTTDSQLRTVTRPKQARSEETLSRLLDVAESLITEKSIADVSILMLSQFLHGEQGALVATAKIVRQVPWAEAKFYAANQVADEARHVEVYHRYLTEKLDLLRFEGLKDSVEDPGVAPAEELVQLLSRFLVEKNPDSATVVA